jgi:CheY-like chemotaxis protein
MKSKEEIVLIEDNPLDSELAIKALRKNGVNGNIRIIRDGAEAIDYFFSTGAYAKRTVFELPRFVLLDLKLPKVNGLEILDLIRSNRFTKTVPVIVFSSSSAQNDIIEAYKKGANSYLLKPIGFKDYSTLLQSVCTYWLVNNKMAY